MIGIKGEVGMHKRRSFPKSFSMTKLLKIFTFYFNTWFTSDAFIEKITTFGKSTKCILLGIIMANYYTTSFTLAPRKI